MQFRALVRGEHAGEIQIDQRSEMLVFHVIESDFVWVNSFVIGRTQARAPSFMGNRQSVPKRMRQL
jgi:hypothetical protein